MRSQRIDISEEKFGPWMLVQKGRKQKKTTTTNMKKRGNSEQNSGSKGDSPLDPYMMYNLSARFEELTHQGTDDMMIGHNIEHVQNSN